MPWLALTLEVPARHSETLSDALLELGAVSVELQDARAGTPGEKPLFAEPAWEASPTWEAVRILALFNEGADLERIVAAAAEAAGLPDLPILRVEPVPEQDWVRAIQSQFPPIQVSSRLWIVPTWHEPPDVGAVNLILDPGLAFGTGSHPTTRLCLRWLDSNIRGGEHVLDYGCGSGILAIAALKLGAGRALGVDIDPQAVEASRANAARNRVTADFLLPDAAPETAADVVVANILANPLMVLAPMLAQATRPGGKIALSGILADQAQQVRDCFSQWFGMDETLEDEGWVLLAGIRRAQD
ncbi:MAG: 50S ribosomal protein L11 methyltransferase [Betaproteobacteria bacterium]|nr:50S ribosomal protein L11 methyltransferase [Betaproteobacteria bacterium]